ncbi:MAG TPA: ABC transporter permease [Solirubrobacterales bacterium]|nr:ABC transporter permease [Solirubrobacterales bacterium]
MSTQTDAIEPARSSSLEEASRSRATMLLGLLDPRRISAIYLALVFMVVFALLDPGTFLTSSTMTVVFNAGAVTCLLALGFLVPLTAGAYDLSIGAVMSFSLTICCRLALDSVPLPLVVAIVLAAGMAVGAINALIIVRFNVNSFIATLGTSQILLAATLLISKNQQLVVSFPESWSNLGNDTVAGVPLPLIYVLAIALLLWYVMEMTRGGRYLAATGGNAEAARLSGVPTAKMVTLAMITSSMVCSIAGVVYSMQTGVASQGVGEGLLFPAIAAVFLGASQFSRRPNVWGTLVAYFALAFGVQGLTLSLGSDATWAGPLFQGVSLVVAVAVASRPIVRRLRARGEDGAGRQAETA